MSSIVTRDAQGLPCPAAPAPFLRPVATVAGPAQVPAPRDALMTAGLFAPLIGQIRPHVTHALLPPQLDNALGHPTGLLAPSGLPLARPPRIDFLTPVEAPLSAHINGLFQEAITASERLGMCQLDTNKFDVSFVSRSAWRDIQSTRDHARIREFPLLGFAGFLSRIGHWLRRQVQTYTTAISFEQGPPGTIYVVRENFFGKTQAQRDALIAVALLQSLQQASYPRFARIQRENLRLLHAKPETDADDYLSNLALSKLQVTMGLDLMPTPVAPVAVQGDSWTSRLMVWRRRPDPKLHAIAAGLRQRPELGTWLNALFETPIYARLLFQRGGEVVLADKDLERSKTMFDALVALNPSHPPTRRPRSSLP